jgi:hypothetical protein
VISGCLLRVSIYNLVAYNLVAISPKAGTMNNSATYPWQTAYVSAILEFEPKKLSTKIKEALHVIHTRMKEPIQFASHEYQAIQDALGAIGVLCAGTNNLCLSSLRSSEKDA